MFVKRAPHSGALFLSIAEAAKGEHIKPVLVSAGPMEKLRRTYPNFFLDINEFAGKVQAICADAVK